MNEDGLGARWTALCRGIDEQVWGVVGLHRRLADAGVRGVDHLCGPLLDETFLDRVLETHGELAVLRHLLARMDRAVSAGEHYDVDALRVDVQREVAGRSKEELLAPLLARLGAPPARQLIPLQACHVAGTTYRSLERVFRADGTVLIEAAEDELAIGDELRLEREPLNRWDDRAIRVVTTANRWLGYIPRARSEVAANLLDGGQRLVAVLDGMHRHVHGWLELGITVCLDVA